MESYLTKEGERIYKAIEKHIKTSGILESIDTFELSMLANSFDLYSTCAIYCKENGIYIKVGNNDYRQVSPEYTVMKNEFSNILKHSPKFGINPTDRQKLEAFSKKKEVSALDNF